MAHTVHFDANIPPSRKVQITLPRDVPAGDAEVVVTVIPKAERKSKGAELIASEVFGMWADRSDIEDSSDYARELRDKAWKRPA